MGEILTVSRKAERTMKPGSELLRRLSPFVPLLVFVVGAVLVSSCLLFFLYSNHEDAVMAKVQANRVNDKIKEAVEERHREFKELRTGQDQIKEIQVKSIEQLSDNAVKVQQYGSEFHRHIEIEKKAK